MPKIISFFNNKGGVSKTTTTFHLGWKMAELGNKVLIVDTDPQCNLTGLCLNSDKENKLTKFYENNSNNIFNALSPVFDGQLKPITAVECYCFDDNNNLFLLPGHIRFSEYDTTYSVAESLTGSLAILRNVPGALRYLLFQIAEKYDIDYILIDMSPSISSTNANIFMSSDYFVLPCAPDYFCYMAIDSLTSIFTRWNKTYNAMKSNDVFEQAEYKFKSTPPKFIGTIQQRYRPRNGSPAKAFSEWIEEINRIVVDKLVPVLDANNMTIATLNTNIYDNPYNLINIADFNSLIAQSQENNTPVFLLTQEQVQKSGKVWENMKANRDAFNDTFDKLAKKIITITDIS